MFSGRYSIQSLKRVLREPSRLVDESQRLLELSLSQINRIRLRLAHGPPVDVMERDWDNMLILDSARYDFFDAQNTIPGTFSAVRSAGRNSPEFMRANFTDRELHDTVYVTANPYVHILGEDVFHAIRVVLNKWHEDPGTVFPADVRKAAMAAHEDFPNKRLIVHFMQPHVPWIGDNAKQLREKHDLAGYGHNFFEREDAVSGLSYWNAARNGNLDIEEIRAAYSESLDIVLAEAETLLDNLGGKSVVTADHGELLGERFTPFTPRRFSHPPTYYRSELSIVPWLKLDAADRRQVTADPPRGVDRLEDDFIEDRLQALGYF